MQLMKRNVILPALLALFVCGCQNDSPQDVKGSYEYFVKHLCGDYVLSDVHWSGTPVDLDGNGTAANSLLQMEYSHLLGCFEPKNKAEIVNAAFVSGNLPALAVNVELPYPQYSKGEAGWSVSGLSYLPMTIHLLYRNMEMASETFSFQEKENPMSFVEGIAEICVTESTPEKLVLRLHCHMCDLVSGKLTKNYLYYTYVRR